MRTSLRAVIPWLVVGLSGFGAVIAYRVITTGRFPNFFSLAVASPGMVLFLLALWWVDRKPISRSASNFALISFSSGWILLTLLSFLQLNTWLYLTLGTTGFIVCCQGTWYIFTKEVPAIEDGRELVFQRARRILRIGVVLIIIGGFIAFLGLPLFSPLRLFGKFSFGLGIVLVDLTVIMARSNAKAQDDFTGKA